MKGSGIREKVRAMWAGFRERKGKTVAELALVALFFLFFLALLTVFFPAGTGLRNLIRSGDMANRESDGTDPASGPRNLGISAPAAFPIAGFVTMTQNSVQSRRADSVAWERAAEGMPLHSRDAVQTGRDSRASIRIGGKGGLDLGEKSLVVIQRMEKDPVLREKRSFLLMVDGELRGRVEGTKQEPVSVDVASAGGVGRIASRGGEGGAADFRVTVNPDRTTTYAVFEGVADVEGMGRTVRVGANQYTVVGPSSPPTPPAVLPAAPDLAGPADGEEYLFRSLPPRVRFSWAAGEPADAFRVVLARDPGFRDRLVDEWVAEPSFVHGNLPAGTHYWRVSAKRGGVESGYPKARTVRLVRSAVPPALQAEATESGGKGLVRGMTAPGASPLVAGKPVALGGKGEFESLVPVERGINVIVVESSDAAGNTSYRSLRLNGKN